MFSADFSGVMGDAFVGFIESFLKADCVIVKANSSLFLSIFKSPFTSPWKLPKPHLTKEVQNMEKKQTNKHTQKNRLVEAQQVATYSQ